MINPKLETKKEELGGSFDLVLLAAKRAKEIQEGMAPMIRTNSIHPLTIAMEEIEAGVYPPVAKEAPKDLDEDFIGAALAEQDLTDLDSRFAAADAEESGEAEEDNEE